MNVYMRSHGPAPQPYRLLAHVGVRVGGAFVEAEGRLALHVDLPRPGFLHRHYEDSCAIIVSGSVYFWPGAYH